MKHDLKRLRKNRKSFSQNIVIPALLAGVTAIVVLFLGLNEPQATAAIWTLALIYAVVTTFRKLWPNYWFWLISGISLVLHAALVRHLFSIGFAFSFYPTLSIAFTEGLIIVVVLVTMFGPGILPKRRGASKDPSQRLE